MPFLSWYSQAYLYGSNMDGHTTNHSFTQSYICYMFTKHLTCEVLIKQANMVKMRCIKGVRSLRMGSVGVFFGSTYTNIETI